MTLFLWFLFHKHLVFTDGALNNGIFKRNKKIEYGNDKFIVAEFFILSLEPSMLVLKKKSLFHTWKKLLNQD